MRISAVVFPVSTDQINVVVFDTESQNRIWQQHYSSFEEATGSLFDAGIASAAEARELSERLLNVEVCPVFEASIDEEDLEENGFIFFDPKALN